MNDEDMCSCGNPSCMGIHGFGGARPVPELRLAAHIPPGLLVRTQYGVAEVIGRDAMGRLLCVQDGIDLWYAPDAELEVVPPMAEPALKPEVAARRKVQLKVRRMCGLLGTDELELVLEIMREFRYGELTPRKARAFLEILSHG